VGLEGAHHNEEQAEIGGYSYWAVDQIIRKLSTYNTML
jgi:hypothetical protein